MAATTTDWRLVEDADKDLDYATVFDDEDFLDLFLAAPRQLQQQQQQQQQSLQGFSVPSILLPAAAAAAVHAEERGGTASSAVQPFDSRGDLSLKPAAAAAAAEQAGVGNNFAPAGNASQPSGGGGGGGCQSCVFPFASASGGLMNIVMLVDPATDEVTLPRQDVIAGEDNRVVTIGPTVLSNFSTLDFTSLNPEILLGMTHDYAGASNSSRNNNNRVAHHPYQHKLEQMQAEPPQRSAENKFLPISSFSLQNDLSSWNPQLLAAAAQQPQPFALGSVMFSQMSLGTNNNNNNQSNSASAFASSVDPSQAMSHVMSLFAPDRAPVSMAAGADAAFDAGAYNCVSESSSLDGGSVRSSGTMAQGAAAVVPAAPSAVAAPLRALSAYNFFFRDERDRILHGGEIEWTKEKQEKLLRDHWNQDRTKKRRHRKSHGKIDFSTLSKVISTRWKELPEDRKDYFREVAARDWERFQRELAEYKHGASADAAGGAGGAAANAAGANSFASYSFSTVIG